MRPIKFKAKCLNLDKWVYGYYAQLSNEFKSWHGLLTEEDSSENYIKDCNGYNMIYTAIDPQTVGQFTGLKDKNDRDIYEGDIIECEQKQYVCEYVEGGFEFKDLSDGRLILKAIVIHSHIIGNIHDNPDLIYGECIRNKAQKGG